MVSAIGSIGSFAASQLFNYRTEQLSNGQTNAALSFDELVGNSVIKTEEEPTLGVDGITAMPSMKKSSESAEGDKTSSSKSEMDLNQDGQVTSDEVIRYLQMQMAEKMAEEMANMQNEENSSQQNSGNTDTNNFKNKIAATAYKAGEALLTSAASVAGTAATSFII